MKTYTHDLVLYRNELPADLVAEFDRKFEEASNDTTPREERFLKVKIQSGESDPDKVVQMLIKQLFTNNKQ